MLFLLFLGRIVLNEEKAVINTLTRVCTHCNSNYCFHFQAFYECSQNNCLSICEANILDELIYYSPNPKDIFLIANNDLHIFSFNNSGWKCSSCSAKCRLVSQIKIILDKVEFNAVSENAKALEYPTISIKAIPKILDEKLVSNYNNQLCQGIVLPVQIFPEIEFCGNGYKYNDQDRLKLENTGIIIYTENDIIELKGHQGKFIIVSISDLA